MGKNKKKFIDKKNASRYHLMHRSQRDVGDDILLQEGNGGGEETEQVLSNGLILWPDPNNNPETDRKVLLGNSSTDDNDNNTNKMRQWRQKLATAGLLDENNDDQYLKPITGTGTFLSANGRIDNPLHDPRTKNISEELLAEVNQQFDGIPIVAAGSGAAATGAATMGMIIDEDIEKALMGDYEEGEFEEIADDFVFDAAKEPEENDQEAFDFDAHIQKLMEDARKQAQDLCELPIENHDWGKQDQEFFAKAKPLHAVGEENDEYDDVDEAGNYYFDENSLFGTGTALDVTPGVVPSLNPDEEKALCEQFEKTLAEYDSDEVGDIEEEEIHGDLPLEGDVQVEAALDNYLQEKEDGFFMQGRSRDEYVAQRAGGSGFAALVGTCMIPVKQLDKTGMFPGGSEPARPAEEVLRDARKRIQSPELEPPPEEIFIDGKSYYSAKERNPWDCESILSTYSNLDNNPVTISTESRRKKKKNKNQLQKIVLSNKTGLPILNPAEEDDMNNNNYSDEDDEGDNDGDNEQTFLSINQGIARKKKETPEEKKARKAQVKKERQIARIQKKVTKEVYKDEFMYRTTQGSTDDVGGKAVFRYS